MFCLEIHTLLLSGEVHHRTGHEGPEGEYRYSSTVCLTPALNGWVVNTTPRPLYPRDPVPITQGWVGPRVGLNGCGKSRPPTTPILSPDRSARTVTIPTELTRPIYPSLMEVNCTQTLSNTLLQLPGGGEIFSTRPHRPWGLLSLLYNGYRLIPGGKAAGAWC